MSSWSHLPLEFALSMSVQTHDHKTEWTTLLHAAREGDNVALGQICEQLRKYLLLTVGGDLCNDLGAKLGASDVVQQAMLEACSDFDSFRGSSEVEFRVWIKRLLQHNLIDSARRYRQAQCRDMSRETSIDIGDKQNELITDEETASRILSRRESDEQLLRAIARLPKKRRTIVEMRHRDGLSYAAIAGKMDISETAARQLWSRTLKLLQHELMNHNERQPTNAKREISARVG